MRPRLLLTINCKFAVDFFARGLHIRTAVARLPLRQLGFLVTALNYPSLMMTVTMINFTERSFSVPSCNSIHSY